MDTDSDIVEAEGTKAHHGGKTTRSSQRRRQGQASPLEHIEADRRRVQTWYHDEAGKAVARIFAQNRQSRTNPFGPERRARSHRESEVQIGTKCTSHFRSADASGAKSIQHDRIARSQESSTG